VRNRINIHEQDKCHSYFSQETVTLHSNGTVYPKCSDDIIAITLIAGYSDIHLYTKVIYTCIPNTSF